LLYRKIHPATRAGSEPVCLAAGQHPRIAVNASGVPHVVWDSDGFVSLARLGSTGSVAASQVLSVSGSFPSLAIASDREIYVAWHERDGQICVARLRTTAER
jgi:hypothetical protein